MKTSKPTKKDNATPKISAAGRKKMYSFSSLLPTKSPGASIIRTKKDSELFDWVEMIVMKNWGACYVEDSLYRFKMKHDNKFSIKILVCAVIIAMTSAVEVKLATEMKAAGKGLIVHEAWTKFGTHYFGLFSTYMVSRQYLVEGSMVTI